MKTLKGDGGKRYSLVRLIAVRADHNFGKLPSQLRSSIPSEAEILTYSSAVIRR